MSRDVRVFDEGSDFFTSTSIDADGVFTSYGGKPAYGRRIRRYCVDPNTGEIIELDIETGRPVVTEAVEEPPAEQKPCGCKWRTVDYFHDHHCFATQTHEQHKCGECPATFVGPPN